MKPSVPDHEKSRGVTFSLKPDLFTQLVRRVEQLGYPWTKSSYVTKLVIDDLMKAGLWPADAASQEEIDVFVQRKNSDTVKAKKRRSAKAAEKSKAAYERSGAK